MLTVDEVVQRCEAATGRPSKRTAAGYVVCCPAHDDRQPSLSVSAGDRGGVVLHCHAGCDTADVLAAVGLGLADVQPGTGGDVGRRGARSTTAAKRPPKPTRVPPRPTVDAPGGLGPVVAEYFYRDAAGAVVYRVTRHEPKTFRQWTADGDGWTPGRNGHPLMLYRLPELLAANAGEPVFVVEGEKDVDNLAGIGVVATCNPGGAGKWAEDDSALEGRHVTLVADKDEPGRKHVAAVASRLNGRAATIRMIEMPGQAKDVSDWLDELDAREPDDLREELLRMSRAAPLWEPGAGTSAAVIVSLADVEPTAVEWLWPERIALGKLTTVAGDPGLGKSFITLSMAAHVSTGTPWPDCREEDNPAGGVVLLSAEDDLSDTIRPRLDAAGADVRRIAALRAVRDNENERQFSLVADLRMLEQAIRSTPGCRLVVVDPISAYMGGTDSHKNAEVRGVLGPLAELAGRYRVAVVAVTHLRKGDGPAMYRTMGSLAFVAAARAAYGVVKDKHDQAGRRRMMLPIKNNLGDDQTGLAYQLDSRMHQNGQPVVCWEPDPVTTSLDEALKSDRGHIDATSPDLSEACDWLEGALAVGPRTSKDLFAEARKDGIAIPTLRRAKKQLGVKASKAGFSGQWRWWLRDEGAHEGAQGTGG